MPSINKVTRPSWIDRKIFERQGQRHSDPFHHTTQWRAIRKIKLNMNPLCEHCQNRNVIKAALIVDHIIPIQFGGEKTNLTNLQSLCRSCDNRKAGQDSHIYKQDNKKKKNSSSGGRGSISTRLRC